MVAAAAHVKPTNRAGSPAIGPGPGPLGAALYRLGWSDGKPDDLVAVCTAADSLAAEGLRVLSRWLRMAAGGVAVPAARAAVVHSLKPLPRSHAAKRSCDAQR